MVGHIFRHLSSTGALRRTHSAEVIDLDADEENDSVSVTATQSATARTGGEDLSRMSEAASTQPDDSEDDAIEMWQDEDYHMRETRVAVSRPQASRPATCAVTDHPPAKEQDASAEQLLPAPGTPLERHFSQDASTPGKTPRKWSREQTPPDQSGVASPKRVCLRSAASFFSSAADVQVPPSGAWKRVAATPLPPDRSLTVFLVAIDERQALPPVSFRPAGSAYNSMPVLDLHGTTREGWSVLLHVHGFLPYFYAKKPVGASIAICRMALENSRLNSNGPTVARIDEVERMPLMHYQSSSDIFLQIYVTSHKLISSCRNALSNGVSLGNGTMWQSASYEANVSLTLRFLVDTNLGGGKWLEVPGGRYHLRAPQDCTSNAQFEADTHVSHVVGHRAEGEWLGVPPLRLLSLHLQTVGNDSHVAAAAVVVQVQGEASPQHSATWVVGGPHLHASASTSAVATPSTGELFSVASETELLTHLRQYIMEADPDVILGHDLLNEHLDPMLKRAAASGAAPRRSYGLGRLKGVASIAKQATFQTNQLGKHVSAQINAEGRLLMDVLTILEREQKLESYSLSALTLRFLGLTRLELRPSDIVKLAHEQPMRLASLVLRDAQHSLDIFRKQHVLFRFVEMGRVTGVPIEYLLTRGQSIKVQSMLLRKARDHSYVLPPPVNSNGGEESSYEGGAVLEPLAGFYDEPVVTLDFASLYPSIMQRHNLCYSTLLIPGAPEPDVKDSSCHAVENVPFLGHRFVSTHVRRGLIPMVLEELLAARKLAKKELKAAKDPQTRAVLDGRQLALKVSANSVYGFTGMSQGTLPCQAIAASVTAYGRQMIERTRQVIESKFNKGNGFDADAKVIYGDTDSVMVTLGAEFPLQRAFEFGKEAAVVVTREFGAPVAMEFEKVYFPYLLMSKKRYAGLAWSCQDEPGKLDAKGIEVVRRDWCGLVRETVDQCLQLLLRVRSVDRAVEHAQQAVAALRQGTVDHRLLVVSKALVRDGAESYSGKQAHVELAERLRRRNPHTAPQVGDRVSYVFILAAPNSPAYDRVEDPLYAMDNELPLDAEYYISRQLKQPLLRIFGPVLGSEAEADKRLFGGDLARRAPRSAPVGGGPLSAFARAKTRCLGCRNLLLDSTTCLCMNCLEPDRRSTILLSQLDALSPLESEMAQLLSNCARCEGSACGGLHRQCANVDCPIFFRRPYVAKELDATQKALEKLKLDW